MARKLSPKNVFRKRPSLRRTIGPMQVHLWFTGREPDGFHRETYSYRMWDLAWDPETPIFQGDGFMAGVGREDAQLKVLDLLVWLTLTEGDTDESFFSDYTPRQIRWRDERAEALHEMVENLELDISDAHSEGRSIDDFFVKKQDWSPRDDE